MFLEMASSSSDISEKDFFEDELGGESMILTLSPVNEERNEEHQLEPSVSSTSETKLKTRRKNDEVNLPQMNEQ